MTHGLEARLDSLLPYVVGLFRIVIGLLFGMNGTIKLFGGRSPWATSRWAHGRCGGLDSSSWWSVCCSWPGLFTRAAAFIGSGQMAVAYFATAHQSKGFWPAENGGELAVVYCFALFL